MKYGNLTLFLDLFLLDIPKTQELVYDTVKVKLVMEEERKFLHMACHKNVMELFLILVPLGFFTLLLTTSGLFLKGDNNSNESRAGDIPYVKSSVLEKEQPSQR